MKEARSRLVRPVGILLALLALLATSEAHPADEFEVISGEGGDLTVYLTPQAWAVKRGQPVTLLVDAWDARPGVFLPNVTFEAEAAGPAGARIALDAAAAQGSAAFNATFPSEGDWIVEVQVNGTIVQVPLVVYPPSPIHVEANALRYDLFYAGSPTRTSIRLVDDATGQTREAPSGVRARIERVDGSASAGEVTLERDASSGNFTLAHEFEHAGEHLVWFASVDHGVAFADLPPHRVNVLDASARDEPSRGVTFLSAAMVLAVISVISLATGRR